MHQGPNEWYNSPCSNQGLLQKVNPPNSCSTVLILGIGNGFLTSHLFTSLKLLMKHTVLPLLGMMKEGEAHSDAG